jgi:hypothetical protein
LKNHKRKNRINQNLPFPPDLSPKAALALISKLKPVELDALLKLSLSGSLDLSKPDDVIAQLKAKAPSVNEAILNIMANISAYVKQFDGKETQKLAELVQWEIF